MCFELNISLFYILHFLYFEEISVSHYSYLYLYNQQQQNFSKLIAKKKSKIKIMKNHKNSNSGQHKILMQKSNPSIRHFIFRIALFIFQNLKQLNWLHSKHTHTHTKLNKTHTKTW